MGPNSLKLLDELLMNAPHAVQEGYVLDLGCGTGITSLFLARETGAEKVFATDLWVPAGENWQRACEWNQQEKIIPIHADAAQLPYAEGFFRSIVSVDAYHYFGGAEKFYKNLDRYGNTSAASIPMCLDEMMEQGLLTSGQRIIMVGFGGGLTWAGAMLTV